MAAAAVMLAVTAAALVWSPGTAPPTVDATCGASNLTAAQLNAAFAKPGLARSATAAGYAGGDYQHVYALPGGRRLWLFQDMFFSNDNDLRDSLTAAAHNAGLVQTGSCWSLVGGPGMRNYIGSSLTTPLSRWFWPMDGEMGADGALWIFMVEMRNPYGTGATWGAAPAATWVARVSPRTLKVLSFTKAPNPYTRLYGWSVVSDANYSYLYGHCYRQYIHRVDGPGQFDSACMPATYLARVPKGQFGKKPSYWTGKGWSTTSSAAKPVMRRGLANPMDVQRFGTVFVNVSKVDDWWGPAIVVDRASRPQGPWTTVRTLVVVGDTKCDQCGNYHAVLMPSLDPSGSMVVALSNGGPFPLWQRNASLYRPTFFSVPRPK